MVVKFSIQNFGSIKDEQTLSFEATKSTYLEEAYVVETAGHRLLKLALIYGANASGKTTVLRALDFLRSLVLQPKSKKTDSLDFEPFLFDVQTPKAPTILALDFIHNEVKYAYKVIFTQEAVLNETLYFYKPNKAKVFERTTHLDTEFSEIILGSKITKDKHLKEILESNILWNNTVLGAYLKTNIDFKELREVTDWFKKYLNPLIHPKTELVPFITSNIDKNKINKNDIINILKKADFNISDIIIKKEDSNIPTGFVDFLKKNGRISDDEIKELEGKNKITSLDIEFEYTINNERYSLPLKLESQGTKRYYGFAGLLALLIRKKSLFSIDELETSLHPDLFLHFLVTFILNTKKSQIIATTHNRELLSDKNIFRNDAIWLTDKEQDGATDLYALSDFDSSVIRDTTNILNAYKSGKLSGVPNLSDTFINFEAHETT